MLGGEQDILGRRAPVFQKISKLPWQRAPQQLELGIPQGLSPGSSGMSVMFKVLSKSENGSTTVLAQFPPGALTPCIFHSPHPPTDPRIVLGRQPQPAHRHPQRRFCGLLHCR